jgi:hypothetical protein
VAVLQGDSEGKRQSTEPKVIRNFAGVPRSSGTWRRPRGKTSDGYRDGSARRGDEARAIPANDYAVTNRKQASEEVGRAHSSLVQLSRLDLGNAQTSHKAKAAAAASLVYGPGAGRRGVGSPGW